MFCTNVGACAPAFFVRRGRLERELPLAACVREKDMVRDTHMHRLLFFPGRAMVPGLDAASNVVAAPKKGLEAGRMHMLYKFGIRIPLPFDFRFGLFFGRSEAGRPPQEGGVECTRALCMLRA